MGSDQIGKATPGKVSEDKQEPAHTPGPWKWTDIRERGGWISGVLRGRFFDKDYIYPVINSVGVIDGLTVEVDKANAHLIAAAPDLLAALKDVVRWWKAIEQEQYERTVLHQTLESASENWQKPSHVTPFTLDQLESAISKAEGLTP